MSDGAPPPLSKLQRRALDTGLIPESLLHEGVAEAEDGFEDMVANGLDHEGLSLLNDAILAGGAFSAALKMVQADSIGDLDMEQSLKVLERRRAILLAVINATPSDSVALKKILDDSFLKLTKTWLDDILSNKIGGVDLLLHFLSSIVSLPVTKEHIASSKMGKAVVGIEREKICAGTQNEKLIKEKIAKVKSQWSASVKSARDKKSAAPTSKRTRDDSSDVPSPTQKTKKAKSGFSTADLLRKATSPNGSDQPEQAVKQEQGGGSEKESIQEATRKQKRVEFHIEKNIYYNATHDVEANNGGKDTMSWSDRKRQEHQQEKELLKKARQSEIVHSFTWKKPELLAENPDAPKVASSELAVQFARMATVRASGYPSEDAVPSDPTPLSDIEQALEMTSQSTAVEITIPFFASAPPAPSAAQPPAPVPSVPQSTVGGTSFGMASSPPVVPPPAPVVASLQGATLEVVTALGLPPFLVGSNVQALQTVASTPGLLQTFVDATGNYDQARLVNLVQTLSNSLAPAQQTAPIQTPARTLGLTGVGFQQSAPVAASVPPPPAFQPNAYAPAPQASTFGSTLLSQQGAQFGDGGYRGEQNVGEGNLHLSGYGIGTTREEILALFAPYVQVSEVVMKGSFAFVNTNDPAGARRVKDALSGSLLGGRPVRINLATRRDRDKGGKHKPMNRGEAQSLPTNQFGQLDVNQVRDDRGNAATKNLFVAGYGVGTSEKELRDLFNQYGTVTGTVMKGSFAFVNTTDRETAVRARQVLLGTVLNGGVLRINFAKESGRLGTSFDTTYNANSYGPSHSQRVFM